jgi:hypothetical protein
LDLKLEVNGGDLGTIPFESVAAFSYFFRMCGFEIFWDWENQKIQLHSEISKKRLGLFSNEFSAFHPFRKGKIELKINEQIKSFLSGCGVKAFVKNEQETSMQTDLYLEVSVMKLPSINEPIIELSCNLGAGHEKWLTFFQKECRKVGVAFSFNQIKKGKEPYFMLQIKYSGLSDDLFWNQYGENLSMIITMGIISLLQGEYPLNPLSILPLNVFPIHFENKPGNMQPSKQSESKSEDLIINRKCPNEIQSTPKRLESEVYFDYHLLIDRNDSKKIKVLSNLHIKNTGTEELRNPIICLRVKPAGSIMISGQILPPNIAETFGVMSDSGTKGWKYMNDNWLEQVEEKGEIWISSIQHLNLAPSQTESISNLQMNAQSLEEYENINVEAFVSFNENELKIEANNQISISFNN